MAGEHNVDSELVNKSEKTDRIKCSHCKKVVVKFIKCAKCDFDYHPACFVQSGEAKNASCVHVPKEVPDSNDVNEPIGHGEHSHQEINLLKRIILEQEEKFKILMDNNKLLQENAVYLKTIIESLEKTVQSYNKVGQEKNQQKSASSASTSTTLKAENSMKQRTDWCELADNGTSKPRMDSEASHGTTNSGISPPFAAGNYASIGNVDDLDRRNWIRVIDVVKLDDVMCRENSSPLFVTIMDITNIYIN
ncbi:unnamed protein product [Phaedon cochleariae]|uniref:Uncharacterized protein n=1 Tax=Phaedon cochleariae TaxID=80249 RepID=A0A9N9X2K4_PHACE|nr:unnamed protein product [Phaedon cochleariae]